MLYVIGINTTLAQLARLNAVRTVAGKTVIESSGGSFLSAVGDNIIYASHPLHKLHWVQLEPFQMMLDTVRPAEKGLRPKNVQDEIDAIRAQDGQDWRLPKEDEWELLMRGGPQNVSAWMEHHYGSYWHLWLKHWYSPEIVSSVPAPCKGLETTMEEISQMLLQNWSNYFNIDDVGNPNYFYVKQQWLSWQEERALIAAEPDFNISFGTNATFAVVHHAADKGRLYAYRNHRSFELKPTYSPPKPKKSSQAKVLAFPGGQLAGQAEVGPAETDESRDRTEDQLIDDLPVVLIVYGALEFVDVATPWPFLAESTSPVPGTQILRSFEQTESNSPRHVRRFFDDYHSFNKHASTYRLARSI